MYPPVSLGMSSQTHDINHSVQDEFCPIALREILNCRTRQISVSWECKSKPVLGEFDNVGGVYPGDRPTLCIYWSNLQPTKAVLAIAYSAIRTCVVTCMVEAHSRTFKPLTLNIETEMLSTAGSYSACEHAIINLRVVSVISAILARKDHIPVFTTD
ncbi:hypothetical protein BD324DRAFT_285922 [Kockovaella imperatae]|uniref:Uncharacterized protein n=1 Tax=Kockovaella imperatae TaxID=4999 RepID=A0A1Y1U5P8_9TREE|nr:hypothetical protein BD324DRAFT_285922 [Kockovaella imperatae]ORX33348.1 hypothetical protein BD324DRAFT_285922 [Kockovaella imperatae]